MTTPADTADLVRHMQWWILEMAGEELVAGGTGLPHPPDLDVDDARAVNLWLRHCAEAVAPDIRSATLTARDLTKVRP